MGSTETPPRMATHFEDGKPRWRGLCEVCGKTFIAKSPRTLWCSDTCRTVGLAQHAKDRNERRRRPHSGRTAFPVRS